MPQIKSSQEVDVYVGQRVRMRRLMLDMSQTTLGENLGVTFQQVQKYEKGRNRISASRLQQIAAVLQVPMAFFFPDERAHVADASLVELDEFSNSRDAIELALAFQKIQDENIRRRFVSLVEALAGDP